MPGKERARAATLQVSWRDEHRAEDGRRPGANCGGAAEAVANLPGRTGREGIAAIPDLTRNYFGEFFPSNARAGWGLIVNRKISRAL
jgi:hypothetical protein